MTSPDQISGRLAFLVAAPYSGATVFTMALQQHPAIASAGELFHPVRERPRRCSCGLMLEDCDFFTNVFRSIHEYSDGYDPRFAYYVPRYSDIPYYSKALEGFWHSNIAHAVRNWLVRFRPRYRRLEREFMRHHVEAVNRILDFTGAEVYLDGTKWLRRIELFAEHGYPSRWVHLVRDPRGFCASYLKNNDLAHTPKNLSTAVAFWRRSWRKARRLRDRFPEIPYYQVVYEEFCRRPQDTLIQVARFLGVETDGTWPEFDADAMHLTGNRVRFTFDGTIRADERWRSDLSESEIALIIRETGQEGGVDLRVGDTRREKRTFTRSLNRRLQPGVR